MPSVKLSVVIPAYNEESILAKHFDILVPLLQELFADRWEVLVVDDGSRDRTADVVVDYAHPAVSLLSPGVNRGKGAALRDGVMASRGELVLMCDADMATPPHMLRAFLDALHADVDIVIGNRRSPLSRIVRKQSLSRRVLGTCYKLLSTWLTGVDVADVNCGFKLFRGDLARRIFALATTAGWAIDIEILALAVHEGAEIVDVPVEWRDGDKSEVRIVHDTLATLVHMLKLSVRLRRMKTGRKP